MDNNLSTKALIAFIWRYMRPQAWIFFIILLTSLAWSLDTTVWPYLLRVVIDILVQFDHDRFSAWSTLKYPVFFGLFFWIGVEACFRLQGFLTARALPKLEAD